MRSILKSFGDSMKWIVDKAMTETTGVAGGYTVPPELAMVIDEGFHEKSIFGTYGFQQPMVSETCTLPRVDLTASHAVGDSPTFGGLSISWGIEGVAVAQSQPATASITLKARNCQVLVFVSNQLVADGGEALGSYLMSVLPSAIAFTVDRECFRGDGLTMPLGVLNSPATKQVSRQGAGHVTQADLANLVSGLLPASFKRAIWACSTTALADICNLSAYMVNRNSDITAESALCGTLFGRPLMVTEQCSPLGSAGDVMLLDPKLYALGSRNLTIDEAREEPTAFMQQMTVYRFIWRGDGQPLVNGTATLADGSTTAAAFCVLN